MHDDADEEGQAQGAGFEQVDDAEPALLRLGAGLALAHHLNKVIFLQGDTAGFGHGLG